MKNKRMSKTWIFLGIIFTLIIVSYVGYLMWIEPNIPVKERPDYTWQQVAFTGVVLFGFGYILKTLNGAVIINYYNRKGGKQYDKNIR